MFFINNLVQQSVSYHAHESSRHAVSSTISSCYNYFIIYFRAPVKVATNNIFGLIENKTIRQIILYLVFFHQNTLLNALSIGNAINYFFILFFDEFIFLQQLIIFKTQRGAQFLFNVV